MRRRRPEAPTLFSTLPQGFIYEPEFLSHAEQEYFLRHIVALNFAEFDFRGYKARRRVVEYGYEYDFTSRKAAPAPPLPTFLLPLRDKVAAFAGIAPEEIVEAVVIKYPQGAPIGWHRDVPQFEMIIGVSLVSSARMRLKPYKRAGKIESFVLDPGSLYIMQGEARWNYQHSIPPAEELRYSITFRTARKKKQISAA
jgi:alkylated DNA repair dioxygenase AlkB